MVFLALHDVSAEMGPTIVLPRTHTEQAHREFNCGSGLGARRALLNAAPHRIPCPRRGDGLLLDSRVLHCGGDSRASERRTLFYFTFLRRGMAPALRRSSIHEGLRNRCRLDESARWLSAEGLAELLTSTPPDAALERKRNIKHMTQEELLGTDVDDSGGDCMPQ